LLDALGRLAAIEKAVVAERALLLAEANYHGATWQQMAKVCHVQRQSLHKRYADRVLRIIGICSDAKPEKPLRLIMELHPNTFNRLVELGLVDPETSISGGRHGLGFRRDTRAIAIAQGKAGSDDRAGTEERDLTRPPAAVTTDCRDLLNQRPSADPPGGSHKAPRKR
jgi:hypothetical protein